MRNRDNGFQIQINLQSNYAGFGDGLTDRSTRQPVAELPSKLFSTKCQLAKARVSENSACGVEPREK
jgi:hypothetical protein